MNIQDQWDVKFLDVVRQSELKRGATREQLLFPDSEEVEELMDDYGYEAVLEREHDDELEDILGEELMELIERSVFSAEHPRQQLISFINGLGFHLLDWIVLLETEFGVSSTKFTGEATKKMEKRLSHFPYIDRETSIFDVTFGEAIELLERVTDGAVRIR
ncbi:hypothetical protein [Ectobacillus funiculus]|uniref:hypothetical protein n=1 Tax=Ectobacillus funiculus TaxID=137993 RepID=UPI00101E1CFF|nr:hypothetical protein [Ectobacillus funiculus]